MGDGVAAQAGNPEVSIDSARPNTMVNEQIFNLRLMTNKLENAYNGMDVEWDGECLPAISRLSSTAVLIALLFLSNETETVADAGSGSGSGSGDGVDSIEEDDDEDRVRSQRPTPHGNSSNRAGGANYSAGSGRQPNAKPAPGGKGSPGQEVASKPDEDDGIEFAPAATTARPEVKSTTSAATPADSTQQPLSATKALARYLVPIVVMWIGNMF